MNTTTKSLFFKQRPFFARLSLILGIFMSPLLCCGLVISVNMVYNDIRIQRFADQLFKYPLPSETEVLERDKGVWFPVNGGTSVIYVKQTMATTLTEAQVQAYYRDVRFWRLWQTSQADSYLDQMRNYTSVTLTFDEELDSQGRLIFVAEIGEAFFHAGFDLRYWP